MILLSFLLLLFLPANCKKKIGASSSEFSYFPRFSVEELSHPDQEDFASGRLPFVLTDVASVWSAIDKWTSLDYFTQRVPSEIVDWYPGNLMKNDDHPILTSFQNAANNMKSALDKSAYIQFRMTTKARDVLFKDVDYNGFPNLIRNDWWTAKQGCLMSEEARDNFYRSTQWNLLIVGNKGAGMFLHPDGLNTGTWQAQIAGQKMWFVCSPDQSQYLYGAGQIDAFNVNLTTHPLVAKSRCITDVISPGELLYYPSNWWHQTLNLNYPTVGLAGRAVTRYNYKGVKEHLHRKCNSNDPDLSLTYPGASPNPNAEVCGSIQQCYQLWRARFGATPDEE